MKKNVLITGGSGFVGKKLTSLLLENGYSVSILSRKKRISTTDVQYFEWDINNKTIDVEAVIKADYIVHLAGESVAEARWTTNRKKAIIDSRVNSIKLIISTLKHNNKKVHALITASGTGIYGSETTDEICDENAPAYDDFLGNVCQLWESEADTIGSHATRVVKIRTGLVLGKNEGVLGKLVPLFKLGLGSALGSGKQYMPWIHIDDLCQIYLLSIQKSDFNGAYNAAVLDDTTNKIFSKTLSKQFGFGFLLPNVPAFILQLVLGKMAIILLTGKRVSSEKVKNIGFEFKYTHLSMAFRDLLN
jgi:uncharacterized protein